MSVFYKIVPRLHWAVAGFSNMSYWIAWKSRTDCFGTSIPRDWIRPSAESWFPFLTYSEAANIWHTNIKPLLMTYSKTSIIIIWMYVNYFHVLLLLSTKLIITMNYWTVIQLLIAILLIDLYECTEMGPRFRLCKSAFQFLKPPN